MKRFENYENTIKAYVFKTIVKRNKLAQNQKKKRNPNIFKIKIHNIRVILSVLRIIAIIMHLYSIVWYESNTNLCT